MSAAEPDSIIVSPALIDSLFMTTLAAALRAASEARDKDAFRFRRRKFVLRLIPEEVNGVRCYVLTKEDIVAPLDVGDDGD